MNERNPDDAILCDVCGKFSGFNDPREPWERNRDNNKKPEWTCEECSLAVKNAREQRIRYPAISFESRDVEKAYDRVMEGLGFSTITVGPTINIDEVKRRRFS